MLSPERCSSFSSRGGLPPTGGNPDFTPTLRLRVSDFKNGDLIKSVTDREVREAVWYLSEDKAPGPDGYLTFFFRRY